jgi:F-type H+-transporting ATPase subunit epsilon
MPEEVLGKFQCVLLTPNAKLLDCRTRSITLPAYDGQIGVWRNHMPMLCRLGLGIMEVRDILIEGQQRSTQACFVIDGGFVKISNNVVTVLAYDVTSPVDADESKAAKMRQEADKLPSDSAQAMQMRGHSIKKAELLMQMIKMTAEQNGRQKEQS